MNKGVSIMWAEFCEAIELDFGCEENAKLNNNNNNDEQEVKKAP
jgi:hypothetical protein